MTKKQEEFADELSKAIEPIIKKHMLQRNLKISDIIYVCVSEVEQIALYIKRKNNLSD